MKSKRLTIRLLKGPSLYDWYINIIPYFGFGNDGYYPRKYVINFGWIFWCIHISINLNSEIDTD